MNFPKCCGWRVTSSARSRKNLAHHARALVGGAWTRKCLSWPLASRHWLLCRARMEH